MIINSEVAWVVEWAALKMKVQCMTDTWPVHPVEQHLRSKLANNNYGRWHHYTRITSYSCIMSRCLQWRLDFSSQRVRLSLHHEQRQTWLSILYRTYTMAMLLLVLQARPLPPQHFHINTPEWSKCCGGSGLGCKTTLTATTFLDWSLPHVLW